MSEPKSKPAPAESAPVESKPTAAMRVEACVADIRAVLAKHSCEIRPYLTAPEPVGTTGERAMIGAAFAVVPLGD